MIKMVVAFAVILALFMFGIDTFRKMNKQEKISLTKLLGYGIVCTVATMVVVTSIVLIF